MAYTVKGCCCMRLRTGGLVIGWIGIVGSVIFFIYKTIDICVHFGDKHTAASLYFLFLTTIAFAFGMFVNGLLLKGIYEKKHLHLVPFLALGAIGMVFLVLGGIIVFGMGLQALSTEPIIMFIALNLLLFIGLCFWAWIVIFSLFEEIRLEVRSTLYAEYTQRGHMRTPSVEIVTFNEL